MTDASSRLAERLADEGRKTMEFFEHLTADQWDAVIYPADAPEGSGWFVRHILAHFVSSEAANALVVEDISKGGVGAPENFDVDRFNAKQLTLQENKSPKELLDKFAALRERTVALVNRFSEADLARQGRHPFFGLAPVEDIIKLIYRHNQIHQRDIRKVIGG
jgi:hypothetical protein